jgi:hypothetical protein
VLLFFFFSGCGGGSSSGSNNSNVLSITSIKVPQNRTYITNDNLDFNITTNKAVDINTTNGTPYLSITIGNVDRNATYISGDGTNNIQFRYQIQSDLNDTDGISFLQNSINLNGASIQDSSNNNLINSFTVPNLSSVLVDSIAPSVDSIVLLNNPSAGDTNVTYQVNFSKSVQNISINDFNLTLDGSIVANISSISSSSGSSIEVEVDNISQDGNLTLNLKATHSIIDSVGNSLVGGYTNGEKFNNSNVLSITSIKVPQNRTYITNDNLDFNITTNKAVDINTTNGTPYLSITIGNVDRNATYISGDGTNNIQFRYQIQSDLNDTDGISFLQNSINLNGASIQDSSNNNLINSFTVPNLSSVLVDSIAPSVDSIVLLGNPKGGYATIVFKATFSENVSNISIDDFNLTTTGTASANIIDVSSSSGDDVNISVSNIVGQGTLKLNLKTTHNLTDTAGNSLIGGFYGIDIHNVDISIPTVLSVTVPLDGNYSIGSILDFNLTISEDVNVTGTPRLVLNIDGNTTQYATYISGTNSQNLIFRHTVSAGLLEDYDGIELFLNNIDLNSGMIEDNVTNDLNTTLNSIGSLSNVNVDNKAPVFQNSATIPAICESETEISFEVNATDITDVSYNIVGTDFSLNGTSLELSGSDTDFETKPSYSAIIFATDMVGNETNQTVTLDILDKDDESNLYIKYVVYDDNLTNNDASDDIVYIYFNKKIDETTIDNNVPNNNYTIRVKGSVSPNNPYSEYSNSLFNSNKIYLVSGNEPFDVNGTAPDTNLSIKTNQIMDWDDDESCKSYPTNPELNQTVATKIEYILKTEQDLGGYKDNGNRDPNNYYDDGYYDIGRDRNYTRDDINGTVIDNMTNLMWQDDINKINSFNNANTYCDGLLLDGYDDWRMPTIYELSNILSYRRLISGWISSNSFKNHKKNKYWSSTPTTGILGNTKAWYVDFDDLNGSVYYTDKMTLIYTRCVRDL